MIKRLRKKFIVISALAVTSVMIILCAGVNIFNLVSVNSKLNNTLDTIIENRGRMPEPGMMKIPEPGEGRKFIPGNENRFDREAPFQTRFFVINFDAKGNVTNINLDKIAAVETADADKFAKKAYEHGEGYGYDGGYKFKVKKQGDGSYMAVFLDCHKERSSVLTLAAISAPVTVFCIALICVIIVLFSGKAMKPVIDSDIKQKQFITDAGHELKTPITVINTCMSVLEMEVGKQKWIDKATAQTEKLKDLVNSLVILAKSDEEREPVALDFNAGEVIAETVDSFADFAEQKGHGIISDIDKSISFCGDEYAVRQLVSILMDNALKYAADGSDIEFKMKKHKKGIEISVSNRCEDIDREELPKLFDRFYRADKARSGEKSGFGLGLSIARGICENHKGSIKAESETGSEIKFTAYLSNLVKKTQ